MFSKLLCNKNLVTPIHGIGVNVRRELNKTFVKSKASPTKYSRELQYTIDCEDEFKRIPNYYIYETMLVKCFDRKNRELNTLGDCERQAQQQKKRKKFNFIYMLIDSSISRNLPEHSLYMEKFDVWKCFLNSIFYVGKGRAARPHAHFREALKVHDANSYSRELSKTLVRKLTKNEKLKRILSIWRQNYGIVSLQAFHNITSYEAHTREAAIIDAMSVRSLTNRKRGHYHGIVKESFSPQERRYLGIALLYKAMEIFLAEGESSLGPSDLTGC